MPTYSIVLISLGVFLALLLVVIALRPAEYAVTRSAIMKCSPDRPFALVNDFREWDHWSPWAKLDPNMTVRHDGPASGVGARYAWQGNKQVGEGRMEILESEPSSHVRIRLEFLKPFASNCLTDFSFEKVDDDTRVTWNMSGRNGFVAKAFTLLMNLDRMIGKDFEKGLAAMKARAEGHSQL